MSKSKSNKGGRILVMLLKAKKKAKDKADKEAKDKAKDKKKSEDDNNER